MTTDPLIEASYIEDLLPVSAGNPRSRLTAEEAERLREEFGGGVPIMISTELCDRLCDACLDHDLDETEVVEQLITQWLANLAKNNAAA